MSASLVLSLFCPFPPFSPPSALSLISLSLISLSFSPSLSPPPSLFECVIFRPFIITEISYTNKFLQNRLLSGIRFLLVMRS
eukprot:m.69068 g.69068  ORF g.69068 m.69068 type:complete len:82 (-) comp19951_c1_seq5:195-440(-)